MKILKKIPMFGILLVIYNLIAIIGGPTTFGKNLIKLGANWTMQLSDLMIIIGLLFLFIEVLKSTRPADQEITDHILSTVVFIIFLLEFVLVKWAQTSSFFNLTLMSLFDVIAGFTISIRTAKRDITLDRGANLPG